VNTKISGVIPTALVFPFLASCAQPPRVGISDPAVFTTLHIEAAQRSYVESFKEHPTLADGRAKELSPFVDLHRHFASPEKGWDDRKLRMDAMLDQRQRGEAFARLTALAIKARVAAGAPDLDPDAAAADPQGGNTTIDAEDLTALREAFATAVQDSPFDRLERARAFYTSYVLALLRLYGTDSRAFRPQAFDPIAMFQATQSPDITEQRVSDEIEGASELAKKVARILSDSSFSVPRSAPSPLASLDPHATVLFTPQTSEVTLGPADEQSSRTKSWLESELESLDNPVEALVRRVIDLRQKIAAYAPPSTPARKAASKPNPAENKLKALESERAGIVGQLETAANEEYARYLISELKKNDEQIASLKAEQPEKTMKAQSQDTDANAKPGAKAGPSLASLREQLAGAENALREAIWGEAYALASRYVPKNQEKPSRRLLLLIQAHVEPGNKPDCKAGLSISVEARKENHDKNLGCQVLFAHPGRTYDLSDTRTLDVATQALSIAAAVSDGARASGSLGIEASERDEARRRYLSRINRTASFVEASDDGTTFGWHFSPSNVQVKRDFWGNWKAQGFIESGARDCAVWLLVPQDANELKLSVSTSYGSIHGGAYHTDENVSTLTVSLPDYHEAEHAIVVSLPPNVQKK